MFEERNFPMQGATPILLERLKSSSTPTHLLPRHLFPSSTSEIFKRKHMTVFWLATEGKLFSKGIEDVYCSEHETMLKYAQNCEEIWRKAKSKLTFFLLGFQVDI